MEAKGFCVCFIKSAIRVFLGENDMEIFLRRECRVMRGGGPEFRDYRLGEYMVIIIFLIYQV